jgi:hypothetical protein
MRCPTENSDILDVLLNYCAKRLDAGKAILLESHMASCAQCRKFATAQQQVWNTLDAWEPEKVSTDFDQRLYAAAEAGRPFGALRRLFGHSSAWTSALRLAAACATAGLALLLSVPAPESPQVKENLRADSVEVELVEQALDDVEMLRQFSMSDSQAL